jgi:hypothetical protein
MRDIRPIYSIGIPVASLLGCMAVAIFSPSLYRPLVVAHEKGLVEHATVICLLPAIVLGLMILRRRRELPTPKLAVWVAILTLGALYYAGEECSWGQNYFRWSTPDAWSTINDQRETNLHNTNGLFDNLPRAILTVAALGCSFVPIVLIGRRRHWDPRTSRLIWYLPTTAVVPAAALAFFTGIPQKIHDAYDRSAGVQSWYSEMFLNGRHGELKEYFIALFILMYLWSFATRLGSLNQTEAAAGNCGWGTEAESLLTRHTKPVAKTDRDAA